VYETFNITLLLGFEVKSEGKIGKLGGSLYNLPISEWISAILYPHKKLAIPIHEIRQFQLFVAITIDHIWYVRNRLVHNEVNPVLAKSL
jgi:hypothetical protein